MHPVLDLVRDRARKGSRPSQRSDGARLGLVIEGGAMRGVVSAGMLKALEHLGLKNTFDAVYGSSAGAVNGAFFLTGQTAYGISIYYEDINSPRFISLRRGLTRKPVMSLSFLLDEVMKRRKVLDWRLLLESRVRLKIAAASLEERRIHLLERFRDRDHLFAALRASCSVPWIAGPPPEIDGARFLDAVVFEPVPFLAAVNDGCSHVLVLLTRPDGTLKGKPSLFERHVLGRWIAALEPRLRQAYLAQENEYDDRIRELKAAASEPRQEPYLYALCLPPTTRPIRWLERSYARLRSAAAVGYETAMDTLLGSRGEIEVRAPAAGGPALRIRPLGH